MVLFQQSSAVPTQRRWLFGCVDDTDGVTAETGLTFSGAELQISKAGGALANFAGTVTELSDGLYMYEATAAELNTPGILAFKVEKTGVRTMLSLVGQVVPWSPYASALDANTIQWRGVPPNHLQSGRVDGVTNAIGDDIITADTLSADAIAEIQAGIAGADTAAIAAAVWQRIIESGYSAEQLLRLLVGILAGDGEDLDGPNPVFKSLDGTKVRASGVTTDDTRNAAIGDLS